MWTFGGAITDRIQVTPGAPTIFAASRSSLIAGWFFPTTLTAAKFLWGFGTIWGLRIDTVTTSLRFIGDAATTDGVWTAPAGLVLNTPTFIALAASLNAAGGTAGVRCWTSNDNLPPVERTVTQATAPVGAWTSGGATMQVGNRNSAAAWQGDIGGMIGMCDDHTAAPSVLGISTVGAISQAEANRIRAKFVEDCWRGDLPALAGAGRMQKVSGAGTSNGFMFAGSMDDPRATFVTHLAPPQAGAVTGAVISTRRTPHSFENTLENYMQPGRFGSENRLVTA